MAKKDDAPNKPSLDVTQATPDANSADANMLLVTIRGNYFSGAAQANGTREKGYEVTVEMTKDESRVNPIAVFRNGFKNYMKIKYPDFEDFATHELVGTVYKDGRECDDLNMMSREELAILIQRDSEYLGAINTVLYPTREELQAAIEQVLEDPRSFETTQRITHRMSDPLKRVGSAAELRNLPEALALRDANTTDRKMNKLAPLQAIIKTKAAKARFLKEFTDIPDIDQIGNLTDEEQKARVQEKLSRPGSVVIQDKVTADSFPDGRPTRDNTPLTNLGV